MHLWQYRIDFVPDVEHFGVRKRLVREHEAQIGKYIFDGTLLWGVKKLAQPLELSSKLISDGSDVTIKFRLVGELHKEDAQYSHVREIETKPIIG